ncbi:FKBP-type peptidyl-prolyl cis-trans isomerase [Nesterenkonia massiliensis]|uniref:peptidylprolyl isomerase n=1 Tax=Nesterenkonia massiliensis TaxID=1232429 RepID=A0ABT2HRV7_9MICC|nr:FKBP-type peptidyl-prolyl cis-trans isomerase [Nesterenkonia massiliensis]MCT1607411.1 FKBP-type peptidyl-prolyl cis-trans isomerase [Nesterenkonia massiliensis]
MHTSRLRTSTVLLSVSALALTACGGVEGTGLGDSDSLSVVELTVREEEGQRGAEVLINGEIDAAENSSRVLSAGDGEVVDTSWIIEYNLAAVDPESGEIQTDSFGQPLPSMMWLPQLEASENAADDFVYDAFTMDGVTVGSDLAIFMAASAETGNRDQLFAVRLEDQYPNHASGEVQEQSGDLPQIDNEIGQAPKLVDHDTEAEAPEELTSEVLIAGEGEQLADDDYVFVQYRGWRWEDGEEFDSSWSTGAEEDLAEDGQPGQPFPFSLTGGVIEGWIEGVKGHRVGDRVLLVIPADQAYGEAEGEDGMTADGRPGGTLIFVVDIIKAIDDATLREAQAPAQQPDMGDMSEEELEELLRQMQESQGGGEGGDEAPAQDEAPADEQTEEDAAENDGDQDEE